MILASRYHDFSAGHKVTGHENKCAHLHGHNYRVHFSLRSNMVTDELGRVVDFSVIKSILCQWLENNWDHRFLMFDQDPKISELSNLFPGDIVSCEWNPTAENMAKHLIQVVAPKELKGTGCTLVKCVIEETRKCSVEYSLL